MTTNPEGWSNDVLAGQQTPQMVWGPLGKLPFTTFGNELIDIAKEMRGATGIPIIDAIVPPSAVTGVYGKHNLKLSKQHIQGDAFVRSATLPGSMPVKEYEAMLQSAAAYQPSLKAHYIRDL
jgi:hypothetical protein